MKSNKLKLLSLLAVSAMLFACGKTPSSSSEEETPNTTETTETTETTDNSENQTTTSEDPESTQDPVTTSQDPESTQDPVTTENPVVEPEAIVKTVDELADVAPTGNGTEMFNVTGIWVPTGAETDVYGNGFLADKTSGKKLQVYGMAPSKDAFTFDGSAYKFTNPKAFQELKSSFAAGDEITLGMTYSTQYKNYYTYFIEKNAEAASINYSITKAVVENGTLEVSAETAVYGTEITVTATPNEGFKLDKVTLNGSKIEGTEGVYKFTVAPGSNEVGAEFVASDVDTTLAAPLSFDLKAVTGGNSAYAPYTLTSEGNEFYASCASVNGGITIGTNKNTNAYMNALPEAIATALASEKTEAQNVAASFEMKFDVKNVKKVSFNVIQSWYGSGHTVVYILKSVDSGSTWEQVYKNELSSNIASGSNVAMEYEEQESTKGRYAIAILGDSASSSSNGARLKFTNLTLSD